MSMAASFSERGNTFCRCLPRWGRGFGTENYLDCEKGFVWHKKFQKPFSISENENPYSPRFLVLEENKNEKKRVKHFYYLTRFLKLT